MSYIPDRYIEFWLSKWRSDSMIRRVLESRPVRRLKDISFLGAIDYTSLVHKGPRIGRDRLHHTLGVAALADFISEHRNYDEETRNHVVVAALLHDIGHAPLSHSAEPYFKRRLGVGHHELGEQFMEEDKQLSWWLAKYFDRERIKLLIAGDAGGGQGADLFESPINIDTIDGILRSFESFRGHKPACPLDIARAAFLESSEAGKKSLDWFWQLKGSVYNSFITSLEGLQADQYCQLYFEKNEVELSREKLLSTEKEWLLEFPDLFHALRNSSMDDAVTTYCQRDYYIVFESEDIAERYKVNKKEVTKDSWDVKSALAHREDDNNGLYKGDSQVYH